jgi:hypothetical protein
MRLDRIKAYAGAADSQKKKRHIAALSRRNFHVRPYHVAALIGAPVRRHRLM